MKKLKLIFVGEHAVGKTSIITQYMGNGYSSESTTTTAGDKSVKEIKLENGKNFNLEIWDTPGQKKYSAANKIFMKNTKIALMVYDITNQKTFKVLNEFYEQINDVNGKGNVFLW